MKATQITEAKKSIFPEHQQIDWVDIHPTRGHYQKRYNLVTISFYKAPTSLMKSPPQFKMIIGKEILDELGWKKGDKICFMHHPDNVQHLLLVKSTSGNGYTLTAAGANNCDVGFKWLLNNQESRRGVNGEFEILPNKTLTVKFT